MRTRHFAALTGAAVGLVIAGLSGSAAHAAPDSGNGVKGDKCVFIGSDGKYPGRVCFTDKGDLFDVMDLRKDGYAVWGYVDDPKQNLTLDSAYAGGKGEIDYFQYNVKNGKRYVMGLCTMKGAGNIVECEEESLYE